MDFIQFKDFYKSHYGKALPYAENVQYKDTGAYNREKILELYKFRYEGYKDRGKVNPEMELLLESLGRFKQENVRIHELDLGNALHLYFTDEFCKVFIGELYSRFLNGRI
ncbi:hypothetical protein COR50_20660 [Chitinophaga caeni]|uniref:Uncharacterized protein n=1 Tax=Chitinophaga caeni TaxID=2029983 RepID=A0A291QZX5_9BACT|nr:hypothetical protein [Chitinophaga caeni]ATL49394.1 hypothetical protein COR50_20660 [Chitinophaga caeni]